MRQVSRIGVLLLTSSLIVSQTTIQYPAARKSDTVDTYHGTKVADPYRWLEDSDSAESQAWIAAENKVTADYLAGIPARERFKKRLTELYNFDRYLSVDKAGSGYLILHNDGLQNQNVLMAADSLSGKERVLIDPNTWRADGTEAMRQYNVSPDGKLLAYGIGEAGSDWVTWKIRDVATGKDLSEVIKWSKFASAAWAADSKSFYYQRFPQPLPGAALTGANTNAQIFQHVVGNPQTLDILIYERPDHKDWLFSPSVTDDGSYLVFTVNNGDAAKSMLFYKNLHDDKGIVELVSKLEANYAVVGNEGSLFYVYTTKNAPKGKIVSVDMNHPDSWKDVVPEQKDVIDQLQYLSGRFVVGYSKDAASRTSIFTTDGKLAREVRLPGLGTMVINNGRQADKELFFAFTGFTKPVASYRLDPLTGAVSVARASKVNFDPTQFEAQQVFYTSKDGTRIPMSLVSRKGLAKNGQNPVLLYGYGGFNISLTPFFSPWMVAWMEMGGAFAVANIRGGSEYGEAWHQAGIKDKKQNVFDDFIAATEYLIAQKYTSSKKLAIFGGSNGGLLVGAVLNQRPDLFAAAMPAVGVMDMLRFHKFTIGSAWTGDYGSSDNEKEFPALYKYSPLHNVKQGAKYPPTLITTADHDDRVVPGHSFKYAATLQAAQAGSPAGSGPILIRIETRAGHGGGTPTAKSIEEWADRFAFLTHELGMK